MHEPVRDPVCKPVPWRRRKLLKVTLVAAALAVLAGVAWFRPRGFSPRPAKLALLLLPETVAVAPGVYLLGRTSPAAAYLVETSEGLVLIDSGLEPSAATVIQQIAGLGFDVHQLRAILLTHVHADHSLGAEHLRGLTGARVYAGRDDCPPLREGEPRVAFFSTHAMPEIALHPTTVDVVLSGDQTIAFGETHFEAIAAPGHTSGSVCYLLERPGLRALFTGDVIQHLGPGSRGSLGTYTAYLPTAYRGDARAYLASLRRLRELPVPDLVLPGHPQMDTPPQSPRLGAERWQALLDGAIVEMERLQARYDADGAAFLDGNPKELLPGLHYLGDCGGHPVYGLMAPAGLFLFDAPGGEAALHDFLARRCGELGWKGCKPAAVLLTSAGGGATAGLERLVRDSGCPVLAPPAGLEEVRRLCPAGTRVLTEEEAGKLGGFEVRAIPLGVTGPATVAYQVRWADKTVLVSSRFPVKLNQVTIRDLLSDIREGGGSGEKYRAAIDRLAAVSPDLWLTGMPVHGQNAFLYDDDWAIILGQHRWLMPMAP